MSNIVSNLFNSQFAGLIAEIEKIAKAAVPVVVKHEKAQLNHSELASAKAFLKASPSVSYIDVKLKVQKQQQQSQQQQQKGGQQATSSSAFNVFATASAPSQPASQAQQHSAAQNSAPPNQADTGPSRSRRAGAYVFKKTKGFLEATKDTLVAAGSAVGSVFSSSSAEQAESNNGDDGANGNDDDEYEDAEDEEEGEAVADEPQQQQQASPANNVQEAVQEPQKPAADALVNDNFNANNKPKTWAWKSDGFLMEETLDPNYQRCSQVNKNNFKPDVVAREVHSLDKSIVLDLDTQGQFKQASKTKLSGLFGLDQELKLNSKPTKQLLCKNIALEFRTQKRTDFNPL